MGQDRVYLFAPQSAHFASATLRGTLALSPKLTLQLDTQLFTTGIAYRDPLRGAVPAAGNSIGVAELSPVLAADQPPQNDARVAGLNVNAILRWEWRLGSSFYLVYGHQAAGQRFPGRSVLSLSGELATLRGAPRGDTLLMKIDVLTTP